MMMRKFLLIAFLSGIAYSMQGQDSTVTTTPMNTITYTGIFEGQVTVGNFDRVEVYKIGAYCLVLQDLPQAYADSLKGKKVVVSGILKIVEGKRHPAKTSREGRIYEPYKEPDKKYILNPEIRLAE